MKHEVSIASYYYFDMDSPWGKAGEKYSPMFAVGNSSSCLASADEPGSKDIKADVAEWGCGSKTINGKISQFLCLLPTPQLLALSAVVNGTVHSLLASNYSEPTALDQAKCEMSPLMLYFFVIMLYQKTCDLM